MAHPKTPLRRTSPVPSTKRYDLHATALAMDSPITLDGKRFTRCPYCGGNRTNQITEHRFHCHHSDCHVRGSAIDLVATLELELVEPDSDGRVPQLTREQMADVRTWMTAHDIEKVDVDTVTVSAAKAATKGRETRAGYKPEVDALWAAAAGVPFDPPCRTFLDVRKLDREAIAELDLARPLPDAADDVSWAEGWRRGHRLMLPVYGATGEMEAIRARWVLLKKPLKPDGSKLGKTMPPYGWGEGAMKGVVLANPVAVRMLRGELTESTTLIVVEGEPDYLTWATKRPDLAVIGIFAGAWTADIAARVPDGSTVVLRTHHDEPGERYAVKVASTLSTRVALLRSLPDADDPERDENALHMAGLLPDDPTDDTEPMTPPPTVVPMAASLPFQLTKDGTPKANRTNAALMLREDPRWAGMVWFNAFDIRYYLSDEVLDEPCLLRLAQELGAALGVEFSVKAMKEAVRLVGHDDDRHSLRDWLDGLTWDGTPRLDEVLPSYFGTSDTAINRMMGSWWMMGAASRALKPGSKMDYTLVLVGPQGKEKSTAVEALAVNPSWFHDTSVKVGTKDGMLALQGCWVMELAELASIKGAALEAVKAFLSSRTDRFRPPYGSTLDGFPRTTAFIGTTNEEQFLTDPTGNRRFWPVVVGDIDIEALKRDREQLWAEAVHRVKAGERHWPEDDEKARLDRYRARFVSDDPWVGPIVDWLDEQTEPFRIDEPMVDALGLAAREMKRSYNRVGAILRSLGYSKKKVRRGASSQRLWTRET